MKDESSFLLGCIHSYFTNTSIPAHSNISWTKLFQYAREKKVMLFLYHILQKQVLRPCPELQKCYAICEKKKKRNLFLAMQLAKLHKICKQQNIEIVCFKGPTLAHLAYNNLAMRDYNDLDILVKRKDIQKIDEILQQQGLKPFVDLNSNQRQQLLLHYHHPVLWIDKNYSVDIHLQLHPKYFDRHPLLWKDNLQKSFANILTLSNEIYLVYLCTHAMRHSWEHLTPIVDIATLIRNSSNLNWQKSISYAQKKNSLNMFLLGLTLSQKLTDIRLPQQIMTKISSHHLLPSQIEKFEKNMIMSATKKNLRHVFQAHDSLVVNIQAYCAFILTPLPITMVKFKLPTAFYCLYPLLQIVSFICKTPSKLLNLLFKDKQTSG